MRSSSFPIHHFTNSWLMYPSLNTDLCSLLSHTIKSDQDTLQQLHPVTHRIRPLNNFFFKKGHFEVWVLRRWDWFSDLPVSIYKMLTKWLHQQKIVLNSLKTFSFRKFYVSSLGFGRLQNKVVCSYRQFMLLQIRAGYFSLFASLLGVFPSLTLLIYLHFAFT